MHRPRTPLPCLRLGRAGAFARRFAADATGAVAIIVAVLAPVLIGGMGLGTEAGLWYMTERKLQNAADLAAHGAARRLASGDDAAGLQQIGEYLASNAEIDLASATVDVNSPPTLGAFAGDGGAVEAIVSRSVPRMFTAIYDDAPVAISARAVALVQQGGTGCVLALSDVEGAITIAGSSDSTLSLCDMVSNASGTAFVMSGGSASVSANCVQTVGTAEVTDNLTMVCEQVRENAAAVADPFADVPEPALTGACQSSSVGQNNQTTTVTATESHASGLESMRFCNGLDVNGTVVFETGLYMIEGGDFTINSNANVSGDGVVFYLAEGVNLHFNGTATVDLGAPETGPYAGIVIFGSRDSVDAAHVLNGNLGSTLDGAIYAPTASLTVSGNAEVASNGCAQFVTGTITFTGSGAINISCEDPAGGAIEIPGGVALVE